MLSALWPAVFSAWPRLIQTLRLAADSRASTAAILRDGLFVLADAPEDRRLEIAQPGIGRLVGEQVARPRAARLRACSAGAASWRSSGAPCESPARARGSAPAGSRRRRAADARRHLGQHADGERRRWDGACRCSRSCAFRVRDAVLGQRQRRRHELRIARGVAQVLREGVVGRLAHLERAVVIAERAPRIGQRGLEMHRAPQRGDGLLALPERGPAPGPSSASASGWSGCTLRISAACSAAARRIALEQPRRRAPARLRACPVVRPDCSRLTTAICAVPARSLTSRYQHLRPS